MPGENLSNLHSVHKSDNNFWRFRGCKLFLLLVMIFFAVFKPLPAQAQSQAIRFYNQGEALMGQGQAEEAITAFAQAVRMAPKNQGMRTRLGWLLLDQNRPGDARPHFEYLLQQRPDNRDAVSGLAISYLRLGRPDEALAVLDRGLGYFPQDQLLLKLEAETLSSRRETAARAVALYEKLMTLHPEKKTAWAGRRREVAQVAGVQSYKTAQTYLTQGDRARGLRAIEEALRFDPDSVGYRTHYGWILLEDGQTAQAVRAFEEVLKRDPRKQDAYLGLAMARLKLGDAPGALDATYRGLGFFPTDVPLQEIQAEAARSRPETIPLAEEIYWRLVHQRPADYQVKLKLAQLVHQRGHINEAEILYREVLAQDPGNLQANLGLARLNLQGEAYGAALLNLEKALAAAPENQEAATGLSEVMDLMRPQLQTEAGLLEDSASFRRSYVYSSWRSYLTRDLRASIGYGYLNYTMNNDPFRGRTREHSVHRHVLPLELNYRPTRQMVLELAGAFNDYGVWGQSGSGRAALYYQLTPASGVSLSYAYYDVIDYYGPFKGPWGRHVDNFADMKRYRYLVIDPTALWTQNVFGASSTQAITDRIRAHEAAFWAYQGLFDRFIFSGYGSLSPYNDGNLRKNIGGTVTGRLWMDPLVKLKYSFFYLGFRKNSIELANLPRGSAPLYWDPIAFKNHGWGVVLEKNWLGWIKLALESDLLYNPGAPVPGALVFLELDLLLTKNLAFRTTGAYLNSVDADKTSYQVRSISAGVFYRF